MTRVSEEYASALFTLAFEEGVKAEVAESLEAVKGILSEYPVYTDLLAAPSIPFDEREKILDEAFEGRIHDYALSFVKLICQKGHIRELDECIDEYLRMYDAADGVANAEVISTVELSEAEKTALCEKLEKKLSRRVEIRCCVDESLLGGVIIKVEGNVMDGSLRTKLRDVKEMLQS